MYRNSRVCSSSDSTLKSVEDFQSVVKKNMSEKMIFGINCGYFWDYITAFLQFIPNSISNYWDNFLVILTKYDDPTKYVTMYSKKIFWIIWVSAQSLHARALLTHNYFTLLFFTRMSFICMCWMFIVWWLWIKDQVIILLWLCMIIINWFVLIKIMIIITNAKFFDFIIYCAMKSSKEYVHLRA